MELNIQHAALKVSKRRTYLRWRMAKVDSKKASRHPGMLYLHSRVVKSPEEYAVQEHCYYCATAVMSMH